MCLRTLVWWQVVYKRYASLYFVMGIDAGDNELITLELVHHYVEVLDRYFGNVCELDLIFNFHKVRRCQQSSACHGKDGSVCHEKESQGQGSSRRM